MTRLSTTSRLRRSSKASKISIVSQNKPALTTILLVEDENLVRKVTGEVLQSSGYAVLAATNALQAMKIFRRHRGEIRLLLTDVIMPGKSGRELALELRSCSPEMKTIFISGYPDSALEERDSGTFFLPKPFSLDSLLRKVRDVLGEGSHREGTLARSATGTR